MSCRYVVLLPVRAAVMRRGSVGEVLTGRLVVISVTGALLAGCTGGDGGGDDADQTGSGHPRTSSSSGVSTPAATRSETPTMPPEPAGRSVFDPAAAMSTVRTLARGGAREATSLGYLRAADRVQQRFTGLGFVTSRQAFRVPAGESWGVAVGSGRTYNVVAVPPGFDPRGSSAPNATQTTGRLVAPGVTVRASSSSTATPLLPSLAPGIARSRREGSGSDSAHGRTSK